MTCWPKNIFTHDEWSKFLWLVNIMDLSMFSRSNFRSVEMATTMSKRIQKRKMDNLQQQNRSQCVRFQQPWAKGNPFPLATRFPISREIRGWIRGRTLHAKQCRRNRGKLQAKHCTRHFRKHWNVFTVLKRLTSNCRRPSWTTRTCKSQIMGTLWKSSWIFVENIIDRRMTWFSTWISTYWSGDCSCRHVRVARFPVVIGLVKLLKPPTASRRNWARLYCGCQPGPTCVALHPNKKVEMTGRRPYVRWTTCYDVLRRATISKRRGL